MKLTAIWLAAWSGLTLAVCAEPPESVGNAAGRIDKILSQLEHRGNEVRDFRCRIVFTEEDKINLTKRTSYGQIWYLITSSNPRFLIHFERSETDGVVGKQEWYLFDGRWLHQGVERIEKVTQQEIVREGETYDPFDLERAPFPLPFGQKKDQITSSFEVSLAPPAAGDPDNTDHLVCVPKEGSRAYDKYDKLEFFVERDLHLPNRIVMTKSDGMEISRADFVDLSERSLNTGLGEKDFERPKEWRKYKVVVEPLPPPE